MYLYRVSKNKLLSKIFDVPQPVTSASIVDADASVISGTVQITEIRAECGRLHFVITARVVADTGRLLR